MNRSLRGLECIEVGLDVCTGGDDVVDDYCEALCVEVAGDIRRVTYGDLVLALEARLPRRLVARGCNDVPELVHFDMCDAVVAVSQRERNGRFPHAVRSGEDED